MGLRVIAGRVHPARTRNAVLVSATPPPHARVGYTRIAILPVQCQQPTDRRGAPADRAADGTAGAWALGGGSSSPPHSARERAADPRVGSYRLRDPRRGPRGTAQRWRDAQDRVGGEHRTGSSPANDLRSLANLLQNEIVTKPRRRSGLVGWRPQKNFTPPARLRRNSSSEDVVEDL